jgi:hypothetical protein
VSTNNSSCPFKDGLCRSNDANLLLDTGYIDSNDDLGLNAPQNQRFAWRYVLQCAPLETQGYTSEVTQGNTTWARYNYGALAATLLYNSTAYNFTYEVEDLSSQYVSSLSIRQFLSWQVRVRDWSQKPRNWHKKVIFCLWDNL